MAWLPIPEEREWGEAYNQAVADPGNGIAVIVVSVGRDAVALLPAQLQRPKVAQGIGEILAGGGTLRLGWIERRCGPLH